MTNSARAQYTNSLTDASMIALQVVRKSFGFHLRTFAPIATAHFFAHVTHHEGKHYAKGANIFHKNGT